MAERFTFPFGQPSRPRPPRRPSAEANLFVLGVYPSALHVRWTPPEWAVQELGIRTVGALAVDDEPTVFWDGSDAHHLIEEWRSRVRFIEGDDDGAWGHVQAAGNGTSGRSVFQGVLRPLGVDPEDTWFTDIVDRFFVKTGTERRQQQADAITNQYAPFASKANLPSANLPSRPTRPELVRLALTEHRSRLEAEIGEAGAPVIITLGEEARRTLTGIADATEGQPTLPLVGRGFTGENASKYGVAGTATIGGRTMKWRALAHPGQPSRTWRMLHDSWISDPD